MIFVPDEDRPLFLASVANLADAEAAVTGGADIVDAKNPEHGALGALPAATVRKIAALCNGRTATSATIGDLPADKTVLVPAALAMAETGIDIVKVGFFGEQAPFDAIAALGHAFSAYRGPTGTCVVGVLMADRDLPIADIVAACARARFFGVMLDTADKRAGRLTQRKSRDELAHFVDSARDAGLFAGLAGSLAPDDVNELVRVQPDALGFRGALCEGGRSSSLAVSQVTAMRRLIDEARETTRSPS